jgi:large subunit ribosomal protein L25
MSDVEVSCLPDNLPEYLELDISDMQLNQIKHLSAIPLPQGVEIVALAHGDDKAVVSVHLPRVEEEPVVEEETEAPAPSEVPAMAQKGEEEPEEGEKKGEKK